MRRYLLILVVLATAISVFWFILPVDDPNQQLFERLANDSRQFSVETSLHPASSDGTVFLTDSLRARRDDQTGNWGIGLAGSFNRVILPYSPVESANSDEVIELDGKANSDPSNFVGPLACQECHPKNYEGFATTSHALTSRPFSHGLMPDSDDGFGTLHAWADEALELVMQRRDDRYVQTIGFADWEHDVPMDVVTGSGRTGQSFLYWRGKALFQSHASYLTAAAKWIPSPGYTNDIIDFSRRIRPACLECHVTYIETVGDTRRFHRDSAVWGVTCERCHGPGKQHVDHYRQNTGSPASGGGVAVSIVDPRELSRERQLDLCGQCHSGMFQLKRPAFSYRPGDVLADFHQSFAKSSSGASGIHTSDQRLRLEKSECFKNSSMTCTTCHNPHRSERGDSTLFARVCQECHRPEQCAKLKELKLNSSNDCISCHMPESENLDMADVIDEEFAIKMVDHYIQIDQSATDRFLKQ